MFAKELGPFTRCEGFDIATAQFPHPRWLPENVQLKALDALTPVPEHMIGKYDIVHVGLLVTVVQKDPTSLLQNLLRMLSTLRRISRAASLTNTYSHGHRTRWLSSMG